MADPKKFFWIVASVADSATANPKGIKILLANALSTFFIKDKPGFCNGHKSLPKNLPSCPILDKWVFDNFILSDEAFAKRIS